MNHIVDGIPSPNPEYPQQIKNVTGNANVKIQNKNLLNINRELGEPSNTDFDNTTKRFFNYNTYVKGITGANNYSSSAVKDVVIEDNNVSFTTVNGYYGLGFPIKVKPNTNYYFSVTELSANSLVRIMFYDKDGTYLSNVNKGSFTTPSNCDCILVFLTGSQANTTYNFTNLQIEQGTTATDFVPHQEQNYPFTFAEGQRGMQGTTLQDDGIHNKWCEVSLTNQFWGKYPNTDNLGNTFGFFMNMKKIPKRDITATNFAKCNILMQKQRTKVSTSDEEGFYLGDGTDALFIKIRQSLIPNGTIEELQTLLSNTNAKIQFELAEEEIIPYNETQQAQYNAIKQAKGYDDQTNISQTNDNLPFILDIEALKGETTNEVNLLTSNNRKTAEYLETSLEPEEVEIPEEEVLVDTEENTESTAENAENSAESEEK